MGQSLLLLLRRDYRYLGKHEGSEKIVAVFFFATRRDRLARVVINVGEEEDFIGAALIGFSLEAFDREFIFRRVFRFWLMHFLSSMLRCRVLKIFCLVD